jgi:hypothetical protein
MMSLTIDLEKAVDECSDAAIILLEHIGAAPVEVYQVLNKNCPMEVEAGYR